MEIKIDILKTLTCIFCVLKLLNVIDWSWMCVLSPMFISLGINLISLIIVFVYCKKNHFHKKREN